jgi:hypothetical protein
MRKIIQTTDGPSGFMALADDGTLWRLDAGAWTMQPELPTGLTTSQKLGAKKKAAESLWMMQFDFSYGRQAPVTKMESPHDLKTEAEIDDWHAAWRAERNEQRAKREAV